MNVIKYNVNSGDVCQIGRQYEYGKTQVIFEGYQVNDSANEIYFKFVGRTEDSKYLIPIVDMTLDITQQLTKHVGQFRCQLEEMNTEGTLVSQSPVFYVAVKRSIKVGADYEVQDPRLETIYQKYNAMYNTINDTNNTVLANESQRQAEWITLKQEVADAVASIDGKLDWYKASTTDTLQARLNGFIGEAEGSIQTALETYETQTDSNINDKLTAYQSKTTSDINRMFDDSDRTSKEKIDKYISEIEQRRIAGEFNGSDGYTPVKGKDYFTESEIVQFKKDVTPKKRIDYFTDSEISQIQNEVSSGAIGEFRAVVQTETDNFNTNASNKVSEFDVHTEQIQADISELKSDLVSSIRVDIGNNILDKSKIEIGKWCQNSGGKAIFTSNEYTSGYGAVVLKPNCESVTFSSSSQSLKIYNYYVTDQNDVIINEGTPNASCPYTIRVGNGKKLFISIRNYVDTIITLGNYIMCNIGENVMPYEPYNETEMLFGQEAGEYIRSKYSETKIIKLPKSYDLIVGDTFEMFYKGISNCLDYGNYDYEFSFSDGVSRGKAWSRKWEWTPTSLDVGTKSLIIVVRDNNGKEIDRGSVNIVVHDIPSSPSTEKVVLCVGDSLTDSGVWCSELRRRLITTDGNPVGYGLSNIKFIGTKSNSDGCKYEGYGGWTFNSYLSSMKSDDFMNIYGTFDKVDDDQHSVYKDANGTKWKLETISATKIKVIRTSGTTKLPENGTLTWVSGGTNHSDIVYTSSEQASGNPFWNDETNANDFASYASKMGVSRIDHCIILLGWNNTGTPETVYKASAKQFIDGLRSEFPNCKITLLGLQVPSRNGFANNYGISWKYYNKLQHVWNINQWYQDIADEYTDVDFVNVSGQFDTEYGHMTMNTKANTRSSEQVVVQSNGVHPATSGYYQIADAVLRNLIARI